MLLGALTEKADGITKPFNKTVQIAISAVFRLDSPIVSVAPINTQETKWQYR
jgi:hypothetical protein